MFFAQWRLGWLRSSSLGVVALLEGLPSVAAYELHNQMSRLQRHRH